MSVEVLGVNNVLSALRAVGDRVDHGARLAVLETAHLGEQYARRLVRVRSGALQGSIRVIGPVSLGLARWQADVVATKIYSRRIEVGYRGPDSRGRRFHQRPHPYMRPADEKVRAEYPRLMALNVARAVR